MIAVLSILLLAGAPAYLLILYGLFIQHERGGVWALFKIFGLPGFVLDLVLNYTLFAMSFRTWPEAGAYTFSKQLVYLQYRNGWRGEVARPIVALLNAMAPSGAHIQTMN